MNILLRSHLQGMFLKSHIDKTIFTHGGGFGTNIQKVLQYSENSELLLISFLLARKIIVTGCLLG